MADNEHLTSGAMFSPEEFEVTWTPVSGAVKYVDFNNFTAMVGMGEGTTNTYKTTYGKFTITSNDGQWEKFQAEVPPAINEYKYWMEQSGNFGGATTPMSGCLTITPKTGTAAAGTGTLSYNAKFSTVATTTLSIGSATGMSLSWQVTGIRDTNN